MVKKQNGNLRRIYAESLEMTLNSHSKIPIFMVFIYYFHNQNSMLIKMVFLQFILIILIYLMLIK